VEPWHVGVGVILFGILTYIVLYLATHRGGD
jgi:hypothetical protein